MAKTEMIHRAFIKEAVKRGYKGTVFENADDAKMCTNAKQIIDAVEAIDGGIVEWYDGERYIGNIGVVMGNDAPDESIYDYHCNEKIEAIMDALYELY